MERENPSVPVTNPISLLPAALTKADAKVTRERTEMLALKTKTPIKIWSNLGGEKLRWEKARRGRGAGIKYCSKCLGWVSFLL